MERALGRALMRGLHLPMIVYRDGGFGADGAMRHAVDPSTAPLDACLAALLHAVVREAARSSAS